MRGTFITNTLLTHSSLDLQDMLVFREEEMSRIHGRRCSTFKQSLLGQEVLFTSDPKNIQAMLAVQFDDFGLGPARRGNMIATLGDGIVSSRRSAKAPTTDSAAVRAGWQSMGA